MSAHVREGSDVGGDFVIVDRIGAGGMGTVFLAQQQSTGRMRALKVLNQVVGNDEVGQARFVREAQVGALIKSEHVVDVVAAGVDHDGELPWIAMELLEGEDLADLLEREGRLDVASARPILRQVFHAMGAAHAAQVVHRDIKPENVFVCDGRQASDEPLVKVLDFGIARMAIEQRSGATTVIGSPAWMPPEQSDPDEPITTAADVWSLGLLTFLALTGDMFWLSARRESVSVRALLREVLFSELPAASQRTDVALPAGFDAWFARCVARDPEERFPDAGEAWEVLEAVFDGKEHDALLAPPPPSSHLARSEPALGGRVRFVVAALVIAGVAAVAYALRSGDSSVAATAPSALLPPASSATTISDRPTAEPPPAVVESVAAVASASAATEAAEVVAEPEAPPPRPTGPPAPPPFDYTAAFATVQRHATRASVGCMRPTEVVVDGLIYFDNDGTVKRSTANGGDVHAQACVKGRFAEMKIAAFRGEATPVPYVARLRSRLPGTEVPTGGDP